MDPVLVAKACQVLGGLTEVGNTVRQAALTYQKGLGKNCSNFVSGVLRDTVAQKCEQGLAA